MGLGDPGILPFVPDRVEALVAAGDLNAADVATTRLEEQGRRLRRISAVAGAARCRGRIAAARGNLVLALRFLASACDAAARVGNPFEFARTLLVHGTVLRRAAQRSEARHALERAVDIFEELGAPLWAGKAGRELARLGGRPAQTQSLTPTEQQVAELVAAGKTNHEVARALHVSPKTVEWNLSKIYRKLGVASRAELAAKYAGRSA